MGVRIAIIGLTTTDTEKMSFPENIKNLDFLDEKESLTKYVKIVREEEQADIVIVLGHAGLPYDNVETYLTRVMIIKGIHSLLKDMQFGAMMLRNWQGKLQELTFLLEVIYIKVPSPWIDPYTHTMVIQVMLMAQIWDG